ncbi:MAG: 1-(5-phosphoribosyl)-5-[Clostridia bacterium]|nr:1-(5-phosphoribosyl)-5-[(5-phosphoribosylamino)methylideneamino]imidazole-4-carboxamide isomerase [Clostridia bacterium]
MILFPAIDLYEKKAVRLFKGDYQNMTVYSDDPIEIAKDFESSGATHIHVVDLEGAKNGTTPNLSVIQQIAEGTSLFVEVGGGIRSMETLATYFSIGVSRAILGTAAVTDEAFLKQAVDTYGEKIAVGADVKDGYVAIKGWLETSAYTLEAFLDKMQSIGVKTVICTDVSKDGAMSGTNLSMYAVLSKKYALNIVASGGITTLDDLTALADMGIYGAIVGKAYYTGNIKISDAIEVTK